MATVMQRAAAATNDRQNEDFSRLMGQPVASRPSFETADAFELLQRIARMFAGSQLVPKDYQGSIANCAIAVNMAARIGADPLMVMQNLVIVHGRPTWSAQFLIATVNSARNERGERTFSPLRYEFFGAPETDQWGCRAYAVEAVTGERLVGADVTIGIAKREGWYSRNGSKWQSIPQQMLMYRAASWWTRAYAPELSMGLATADEADDIVAGQAARTESPILEAMRQAAADIEATAADNPPPPPADMNPETGEVPPPDPAATRQPDPYDDWRLAFADCATVEACNELMASCRYKPKSDDFATVRAICDARKQTLME